MSKPNQEPVAIILAGGQGERLSVLSENRPAPSVPFAGKYRIIDFVLSNSVNSGLNNLMVLTQYRPLSLHDHIGNGKPWDLDRQRGGIRVVSPFLGPKDAGWDRGTADAVYRNLEEIVDLPTDTVLILGGDHVYKMDYRPMINFHQQSGAAVTLGVIHVPFQEASRFGVIKTGPDGRVREFQEKPSTPTGNLVSMGIYVFDKDALITSLTEDAASGTSKRDFGRNILPKLIEDGRKVYSYEFQGYWRDIGTIQSYWEAHMDLLKSPSVINLYDRDWVIYTRSEERPPALISDTSRIERSLISHGCQIRGQVIRSVLSPGVVVEEGAVVRDSVIMLDTVIGKNSVVDRVVLDKEVIVGPNSYLGFGDDTTPNQGEPHYLSTGITVVGKNAELPAGLRVGRNCKLGISLQPAHFSSLELASGQSLEVPETGK